MKGAMRLEHLELRIDRHAYERYCERVEPIGWQELERQIRAKLRQHCPRQKGFVQIDGIWWRASIYDGSLILHTCYGRTHIDLPAAIKWAKRYKDRIGLGAYGD